VSFSNYSAFSFLPQYQSFRLSKKHPPPPTAVYCSEWEDPRDRNENFPSSCVDRDNLPPFFSLPLYLRCIFRVFPLLWMDGLFLLVIAFSDRRCSCPLSPPSLGPLQPFFFFPRKTGRELTTIKPRESRRPYGLFGRNIARYFATDPP